MPEIEAGNMLAKQLTFLSGADAAAKIDAGAKLIQIYSGFIYRGPELVAEAAAAIAKRNISS